MARAVRIVVGAALVLCTACGAEPERSRTSAWSLALRIDHPPARAEGRGFPIALDLGLELSRGRSRAPDGTRIELTTTAGRFSTGRSAAVVTTTGGRAAARLLFFSTTEEAVVTARAGDTQARIRVAPGAT